ncbi:MAG: peptide deformylase [Deltaproteobacteria bacterium]|nr:peptide deformylase [Deltaproteobacteria bacterium]
MGEWTRREVVRTIAGVAGAGAWAMGTGGCAAAVAPWVWKPREEALLAAVAAPLVIPPVGDPDAALLRDRAREIAPGVDLVLLERKMRAALEESGGVGLAAPQVGVSVRAILVMLDARGEAPRTIWCVNPRIVRRSDALQDDIEGCLSIPDVSGLVRRNLELRVAWCDGEQDVELDVSGFDARIFQHEIDHLDGVLFTDRLVGPPASTAALRPLREELQRRREQGLVGDVLTPDQIADLWTAAASTDRLP